MHFLSEKTSINIFKALIFLLLFVVAPAVTNAAALSVSPSAGNFEVGNRVTVKIIATSNTPLNAVSGTLSFPASTFAIESVSKSGSVLNFWVTEPVVSKSTSSIKFEGVALGGFNGPTGTVLTVNLRAIKAGSGSFSFQSGQILANDGEGTDITGNLIGATFSVAEAQVKPETTPKPEINIPEVEVEEEIPQPKPTLKAPEILLGSKFGDQIILGKSNYPNTQTIVTFTTSDGVNIFILGNSDSSGSFSLPVPKSLKRGYYTVTAVMVKADKSNSEVSNSIFIKVGSIFSDITREVWGLIGLLIASIIYLVIRTVLHFKKDKSDVRKVEKVVHQSFDLLREDIIDYDNKKLTTSEHNRMQEIKKDIADAEKVINSKVKDIENR